MSELPPFLRPLARDLCSGPADSRASRFLRRPDPAAVPASAASPAPASAVLALICGPTLETASLIIEERAHSMRSQPGQFALPGGRVDPGDPSRLFAALREAREEIGLDVAAEHGAHRGLTVLGAFAPVQMPARAMEVTPVVAWHPSAAADLLPTLTPSPAEVERIITPALVGPGSLTDPAVPTRGRAGRIDVGIAFDLPIEPEDPDDDAFVWGFTAALIAGLLTRIVPGFDGAVHERVAQVPHTRLLGERKPRGSG